MASGWICWLILACQVLLISGGILYPRESETRSVKSLDGIWQFRADNVSEGIKREWYKSPLSDTGNTISMPVPSSYNDITQEKALREYVGTVWYDKQFFVPQSWRQDTLRVWLRFGSVHYAAKVWINGEQVLSHEIGHLPFQAEVSNILQYDKINHISVEVNNTLTSITIPQGEVEYLNTYNGISKVQKYTFDFFNYAGIHRPVILYTTPSIYIDDVTIYTDISAKSGIVYFNVTYGGLTDTHENTFCRVTILDSHSKPVGKAVKNDTIGTGFIGKIEIPEPHLWWPYLMDSNPGYLYTFEVTISSTQWGVNIDDVYRLPFGIRTVSWSNTNLYINNVPVYLRGFGRHEDSDIRGKGLDLAVVAKDYNLLKWVGANAYRTSHYPYAEEIMDFADQQGIMIIDECPSVNAEKFSETLLENHKSSLTQLIQRDKNRPSVIMWSIANEPRSQLPKAAEYFKSVVEHVKTLDATRAVTAAINRGHAVDRAAQFLDIIGFNRYNAWYSDPGKLEVIQYNVEAEAEEWHKVHNKPVIMMEYGADTMPGLHLSPSYTWSEEYQIDLLSEHFKAFDFLRNKSFFIGEMIWNFADFKTDQSVSRVGGNKKGIFTRQRQPKASAHHVRERYFKLANELDGHPLPDDLVKYTAPAVTRNEL